ncbi:ATP-dependent helicase HrpB [Halomonas sp. V046]|uniref:ATP-dependent helicase HrpB n=1 Tax=Halomonas sp. V046 TaxID=3459611 RepID=UPI004044F0A5
MSSPVATSLPIDAHLSSIRRALATDVRLLLVAEPGAGKTTRVPLDLLDAEWCRGQRLLLLEPRRVAARLAAGYMAQALGEEVGQTVGYRMRGESRVSGSTRLEVVTQGVLSRMLQHDPMLEGVAGVLFDEFHERSLEADLGLALALDAQQGLRDDLRLVVMSATLDVAALKGVLGQDVAVIDCAGRQYPVTTRYRPTPSRMDAAEHQARTVLGALDEAGGDGLVILPGVREIERLFKELKARRPDLCVLPLHGRLPLEEQRRALTPLAGGKRRVVLSTAIAESSVTVDGVRLVVDAGFERGPVFAPRTGLTRLETRRVNRASADQRRGRAGRQGPGLCVRLWAEEHPLVPHAEPEIRQADLSGLAFELARWGVKSADQLSWVTPPGTAALAAGRDLLRRLGLIDERFGLTELGRRAVRWPTHPRLAAMLERAAGKGAGGGRGDEALLALACALAALLEGGDKSRRRDLAAILADCLAPTGPGSSPSPQWRREAKRLASRGSVRLEQASGADLAGGLGPLLIGAYPDRLAQQVTPGRFRLVGGGLVSVAADDVLAHADFLIAVEVDGDPREARLFRGVRVSRENVVEAFPESLRWRQQLAWSEREGRLIGDQVQGVGAVVLARRPLAGPPSPDARREALLDALRRRERLPLDAAAETLRRRVQLLRENPLHSEPTPQWPDLSDAVLMSDLDEWLGPTLEALSRFDQVEALPWSELLARRLPWPLAARLDELAPPRLPLPSGDSAAVRYDLEGQADNGTGLPGSGAGGSDDKAGARVVPVLAAKLQALFGCRQTPRIVAGRVAVRLELLSPARRPLAVTSDLDSFWRNAYPEVRKEMRGRYPRHPWPEDPFTAVATMRTQRRR